MKPDEQAELDRLQAIATAAYNVYSQREAGACAEARQIGWEELEATLIAGPSCYMPAVKKEVTRTREQAANRPADEQAIRARCDAATRTGCTHDLALSAKDVPALLKLVDNSRGFLLWFVNVPTVEVARKEEFVYQARRKARALLDEAAEAGIEIDHKAPMWQDLVKAANEIDRLQSIVDKLPKCWRLNKHGKLVQDVPIILHGKVWVRARTNEEWGQYVVDAVHADGMIAVRVGYGLWERFASDCYSTREAAEKRGTG